MVTKTRDRVLQTAAAFRLLADPTRCRMLLLLSRHPEGMCVSEISEALDMSQSATSHQLGKLERNGVLSSYREGQMICYEISSSMRSKAIIKVLKIIHG
jgi:DNA-binding transcriptional ArsR family regulator